MNTKTLIGILITLVFAAGAGYLVYMGRPVMKMEPSPTSTTIIPNGSATSVTTGTSTTAPAPNTFTLADIQTHNSPGNCWAAVEGSVYDLTTWISRHPGGPGPIQGMCGTDATARFERKHGNSNSARAALVLLKIGTVR